MKTFTGYEYLLIDVANNHHSNLDKQTFEDRIQWVTNHLDVLESEAVGHSWKERPLFIKAVQALRKAQQGIPTGHLVGFDAINSGMQLMSALTGCYEGALATGLVDPDHRADAYTKCTTIMSDVLGRIITGVRDKVKQAVMTSLYGSQAEPAKEFGKNTPELQAFYQAMQQLCPGAVDLLNALMNSWRPYALAHETIFPDGFFSRVKVKVEQQAKIEVDELNHSTFKYIWYENEGVKRDVKNVANTIHGFDAYVLRTLLRRCNYDADLAQQAYDNIQDTLMCRALASASLTHKPSEKLMYYKGHFERSTVADIVILEHLTWNNCQHLSTEHLNKLQAILDTMLKHKPFEVVTIHDDFKCHPNNMNHLRSHYRNILAELADSQVLDDILSQLYQSPCVYQKQTSDLSKYIRQSNYALS